MKKVIVMILLSLVFTVNAALAYDAEFAAKANQLLSKMDQQTLSTSP